jgi:hypothetical protein
MNITLGCGLYSSHCEIIKCSSHCNVGICLSHYDIAFCTPHCDIWKCLSLCDIRIFAYITPWCYGSSHGDDRSMCVTL